VRDDEIVRRRAKTWAVLRHPIENPGVPPVLSAWGIRSGRGSSDDEEARLDLGWTRRARSQ